MEAVIKETNKHRYTISSKEAQELVRMLSERARIIMGNLGIKNLVEEMSKERIDQWISKVNVPGRSLVYDARQHSESVSLIRKPGVHLWDNFTVLSSMRESIQSGRFGLPKQIIGYAGQNFPYYRPEYRGTYYVHKEQGGGAIQDAITHLINASEWLVGPIERLVSDANKLFLDHGSDVEDTVHVIAQHSNGIMGLYGLNQFQMPNECVITVVCTEGTLRFEKHNGLWKSSIEPEQDWKEEKRVSHHPDDFFTMQAKNFIDSIEGKELPKCDLLSGIQSLKVNLTIIKSSMDGGFVST